MDYVSFGSITVPTKWLFLAVALLVSYFLLKLHKNPPFSSKIFDAISNSILVGVVILKLSLIIIEPNLVMKNPLSLLYFTGGELGYWMAVSASGVYFFWDTKKKGSPFPEQMRAAFFYILFSYSVYHLAVLVTNPGWEPVFYLLFSAAVLIWVVLFKKGIRIYSFALGFAIYQIILANIFPKTDHFLSYEHFFYTLFIVLLLFFKKYLYKPV